MASIGQARYSAVARWLHWILAVLVILNVIIGIAHDPLGKIYPGTMEVHKSIGFTVLALTILRLLWRLGHKPPPLPAYMSRWQVGVARLTHWLMYAFMLALPMTGWIFSSAGKYPLSWFGVFDIHKFALTKHDPIVGLTHQGHVIMGFAMAALVVLHVGAALWHHYIVRDNLIARMR